MKKQNWDLSDVYKSLEKKSLTVKKLKDILQFFPDELAINIQIPNSVNYYRAMKVEIKSDIYGEKIILVINQ